MDRKLSILIIGALCIFTGVAKANFITDLNYRPYIGADFHYRHLPMREAFGGNVFAKRYKQAGFVIGTRINDNFGLELGYHSTANETRKSVATKGKQVLGEKISQVPHHYLNKSSIDGYFLNILGYYPLFEMSHHKVEALGYIGAANMRIRYTNILLKAGDYPQDINTNTITFNKNRLIFKSGIGIQCTQGNSSIRFLVNYENTSSFRNLSSDRHNKSYHLKLKDSISFGLGVALYMY